MNYKLTKRQAKELLENKLLHFFGVSAENATYEQFYKAIAMIFLEFFNIIIPSFFRCIFSFFSFF